MQRPALLFQCALSQHEVGVRNLEILENTTDARGRKLEVVKVHCPPPLFRTYKEAEGVHVSTPSSSVSVSVALCTISPQEAARYACSWQFLYTGLA